MAKINLNRSEKQEETKENYITGMQISVDAEPPKAIIFYSEIGGRYFWCDDEKIKKAIKDLADLIEESGEEF